MSEINIKHLGKVFRQLGGNVEQELPPEYLVLLKRLDEVSAKAVATCPQCSAVNTLAVVRPAPETGSLDERRCKVCGQVVLELAERSETLCNVGAEPHGTAKR